MDYQKLSQIEPPKQPQSQSFLNPDSCIWKIIHSASFLTGGVCFIFGTLVLFDTNSETAPVTSSILYVIGSLGFLTVDALEFITFKEPTELRINISMSLIGSLLYVIGSAGFYPKIYNWSPLVGILGFILGSFFIGVSQLWKSYRIGSTQDLAIDPKGSFIGFSPKNYFKSKDKLTQLGVELSAGLGAWNFFFGTIIYWIGPQQGATLTLVLWIWVAGSVFFTLGALFLFVRHAILGY